MPNVPSCVTPNQQGKKDVSNQQETITKMTESNREAKEMRQKDLKPSEVQVKEEVDGGKQRTAQVRVGACADTTTMSGIHHDLKEYYQTSVASSAATLSELKNIVEQLQIIAGEIIIFQYEFSITFKGGRTLNESNTTSLIY